MDWHFSVLLQLRHGFYQKCLFTDSLQRLGSHFARTSSVPLEINFRDFANSNFWTKFGLLTHCVYVGDIYICHSWPSKIKRHERHHAALQEHYLYSSGHLLTSYLKRWNFFSQSIEVGIQLEKKSELLKCFSLFFFQTKKGQETERCDYTTYRKQMQNI